MREQMTFYRSFWEAIKRLKNEEDRLTALEAIIAYGLDEQECPMTDVAEGIFILAKPTLDASKRKSECAKRGSKQKANTKQSDSKPETNQKQSDNKQEANKKQTRSKLETNGKQSDSKTEANKKQSVNKSENEKENEKEKENEIENEYEYEKEIENECYIYISPQPPFSEYPVLQDAFEGWLRYKKERKDKYTDEGMKRLISQIRNITKEYGADAVAAVINESMASGYQGIVFDRLKRNYGKVSGSFLDLV